eukprot:scaffold19435_cov50-Phaeocystis_antarctica.AAC.1
MHLLLLLLLCRLRHFRLLRLLICLWIRPSRLWGQGGRGGRVKPPGAALGTLCLVWRERGEQHGPQLGGEGREPGPGERRGAAQQLLGVVRHRLRLPVVAAAEPPRDQLEAHRHRPLASCLALCRGRGRGRRRRRRRRQRSARREASAVEGAAEPLERWALRHRLEGLSHRRRLRRCHARRLAWRQREDLDLPRAHPLTGGLGRSACCGRHLGRHWRRLSLRLRLFSGNQPAHLTVPCTLRGRGRQSARPHGRRRLGASVHALLQSLEWHDHRKGHS